MKVILVDDESLAIARLQHLLKTFPDIEVIGSARTAVEAVRLILSLRPDLVMIDVEIGNVTGYEVIEQVDNNGFRPKYIVVTAYLQYTIAAIRSHVDDFLLKPVDLAELKAAIQRISAARINLSQPSRFAEATNLTQREKTVMEGMIAGKTSRVMAVELCLSPHTIDTFRRKVLHKMNARNTVELLAIYNATASR